MQIPVYSLEGIEVCQQQRNPGDHPRFYPRGVKIAECRPHIERILDAGVLLVCEGPTDAMAASKLDELSSYSIVGAWSSSTIPPREWWVSECMSRSLAVVACGDNDNAGQAFNQRVANILGYCYALRWPTDRPPKWDVKDEISQSDSKSLLGLIEGSLAREPLKGSQRLREGLKRNYRDRPGMIRKLIEEAGGRRAFQLADDNWKYYCPLHDDREDASLTVNDRTGQWFCWAEGIGGGPVQFIMKSRNLSYEKAIELMRKYA